MNKRTLNKDIIFLIGIFLLPFENFFFAPSSGWATITPIIFAIYILCNFDIKFFKLEYIKKIGKHVYIIGAIIILNLIAYLSVGINIINVINAIISIGLGLINIISMYIYYNKNKNLNNLIKVILLSYSISLIIGIIEFITIKFEINILYNVFDIIFKRNYLKYNRVQFFFTEPSFIGMHIFGILLPLYLISKNKKILFLCITYVIAALLFESGVRIIIDVIAITAIFLLHIIIKKRKYIFLIVIPLIILISLIIGYRTNDRIKRILDDGIYADGSLASRYFRIQSSIYGYINDLPQVLIGYGVGNSIYPLRSGYGQAIEQYKSSYLFEMEELADPEFNNDSVSYCLYIRFISEFGLIVFLGAIYELLKITKESKFKYKWPYLIMILYIYLQFESYAFYAIWIYILCMYYTNEDKNLRLHSKKDIKKHDNSNRVLVFGMTENPGGIESVIMNYYRNINKNLVKFDFLCNTQEVAYEDEIKKNGGKIYRITPRSKSKIQFSKDMKEFFSTKSSQYSAIWVNVCSLANIDYIKYAKKYGIKKRIIHSHNSQNMDSFIRGLLHRWNKIFLKKYATDFWSCSEEASKWFYNKKIMNCSNYRIVRNAIDFEKYSFNKDIGLQYKKELGLENKIVIGNIGRLHFQKNQEFLVEIFYELSKLSDKFVMILVGDGEDYEKINKKIHCLKLEKSVKLLGIRNDVNNIFQAMDALVFPSKFEGLPLVLIEAQANGLPIFASDTITNEVKMSENIKFISLEYTAKEWADIIFEEYKKNNFLRVNNYNKIEENGYEINYEVKKLEKYFEGN